MIVTISNSKFKTSHVRVCSQDKNNLSGLTKNNYSSLYTTGTVSRLKNLVDIRKQFQVPCQNIRVLAKSHNVHILLFLIDRIII
jgi:hypothetical protein